MDMVTIKSEMQKMRAEMEPVQAFMKDSMANMAAADAALELKTRKDREYTFVARRTTTE